jgi:iron complex transport system ATP-binding protein
MLNIQSLQVSYGKISALNELSLDVREGEIFALIGPNGAGKSTLIRTISGVVESTRGSVYSNGTDLTTLSYQERARLLAVVPQAQALGGAFTVKQAVLMGRTAYMGWMGRPDKSDLVCAQNAMDLTQTTELAERRIAELSGGEQQRVLLARALAQDTPILLLDEPTNHLDLHHQISFLSLVLQLTRSQNLAVLMAMHDLNHVSVYADRVALLVKGKLVASGTPAEVLTEKNISSAYQTPVKIIQHPEIDTPLIFPSTTGEDSG